MESENVWSFVTGFLIFLKIFFMWTMFLLKMLTIFLLFSVLYFLARRHVGSQLPNQGSNLYLLHWKAKS